MTRACRSGTNGPANAPAVVGVSFMVYANRLISRLIGHMFTAAA
jgi:hypothetical protein